MSVRFSNVFYIYDKKTPLETAALNGVNFEIEKGSFTAIVGRTGCGKSTLVQHINALVNPTEGEVVVDEFVNAADKKKRTKKIRDLRKKVGLVFQFPEYQLFEETVEKDVAFGPKNFGMKPEDALNEAHQALAKVGLGEEFYSRSPFELSGGEKRRASIAGILAIHPEILVIDEPTAGLDPIGAKDMMELFESIHKDGTTVILVTHDMNIVLDYADRVIVMEDGKVAKDGAPAIVFEENMERYSLATPLLYRFVNEASAKGLHLNSERISDIDSLADEIIRVKGGQK